MHVCFISHLQYPASASTAINMYTRHLVDNGVDVTVIAGRESEDVPREETLDGVDVYRIETDLSTKVSLEPTVFGYRALRRLDDLMDTTDIDVLHLRSFPNLGLVLSTLPFLDAPEHVLSDVRSTAISNRVFEEISRLGIRIQDWLVDETAVIDEHVATHVFGDGADVPILPLGVDFELFDPDVDPIPRAEWGFDADDIVVGYTGNVHASKGIDTLIDAFVRAHDRQPKLKLVLVGDGPAAADVRAEARASGLGEQIHIVGRVPFQSVPRYVNAFDIGAAYIPDKLPFRNQPPLKTVEFLASGVPVVATDTPGNRRFATHEENALVVDDSAESYADALATLAGDESRRKRLAGNARASVSEYDYSDIVTERLIPLYRRLIED